MESSRLPGKTTLCFIFALAFQLVVSALAGFTTDPLKYEIFARHYLNGILDHERLIDCSPLYFYFHLMAAKYVHWSRFVHIFQALLQAASAVLLFKLARLRFSGFIAAVAVFLFVTSRSVIIYTNLSEPEPFMVFFLLAYLYAAMKNSTKGAVFSGIFLSCSLLTRSNFLPLALLTPLFFVITAEQRTIGIRRALLFIVPVLLAVSFLMYRNSTITGNFTPFSMNPGYVFFEGNNPNSNGDSAVYPPVLHRMINDIKDKTPDNPHVLYRLFPRRITGKQLTIPEVNAYWTEKGWNFLLDHPLLSARKGLYKLYSFFNDYRKHDLPVAYNYDAALQQSYVPTIPFALTGALALIGLLLSLQQWKNYLLLYGAFFSQMLVMTMTYVSDRQRVAVLGVLILFACLAIQRILVKRKPFLLLIGAACVLTATFRYRTDLLKDHQYLWTRSQEMGNLRTTAMRARGAGKIAEASDMDAQCLALTPALTDIVRLAGLSYPGSSIEKAAVTKARAFTDTSPSARFDMAILLIEADLLDEAEQILLPLARTNVSFNRHDRQSSQPRFYLARIAELRQRNDQAATWLKEGLDRNPGDPWILAHLAVLTGEERYRTSLMRYFDEIDAEFLMGKAFLMIGKNREALRSFGWVMEKVPEYRTGRIYLSLAMAGSGMYAEAARNYLTALRMRPDEIFAEEQVIGMFRKAAQASDTLEARYNLGVVLQDFGQYGEALHVLRAVLQSGPPPAMARECADRIGWIEKTSFTR